MRFSSQLALKDYLDEKVHRFNKPEFIKDDPISIPHLFSDKQDIEIMGFWSAMLAWGQRKTIISKSKELITLMDGVPFQFVTQHEEPDLKPLLQFKHRTFNDLDALYFVRFFKLFYQTHASLEEAFLVDNQKSLNDMGPSIRRFHEVFFSFDAPHRTRKHVPTPDRKSACKRINMFLRWMVRADDRGVDFGIWKNISTHQLVCPCDLHVDRVARGLGLITRVQTDWQTAIELTENLKKFDANDPVKYDFALFGLGIEEKEKGNTAFLSMPGKK